ncbi:hypothetical protein [Caulobacter sp. CCG-8]|uniref:hypothetical protein n=1 Tax=Caulobacter sp. CCG-8 TaxID=3127958 RepID=UPI00307D4B89
MFALLLAAALTVSTPTASCLPVDPADLVVERQVLKRGTAGPLEAYSVSRRGEGPLGYESSRVVIYAADCRILYEQVFDGALETHFTPIKLGDQSLVMSTTMSPGGSSIGFEHVLLGYDHDGVFALAPRRLTHSNMDGFHVGDLGRGRGLGLALWTAIWGDEAHYDPHRYRVRIYRWRGDHFSGPETWTTRKRYDPDPLAVAKALGLPVDQSDPERFKLSDW